MVSCLVIDRNEGERQLLGGLMADIGFACTEVDAMEDGVRFCQHNHPDVVVMDATALPDARDFLRLTATSGRRWRPTVILYADKPDFDTMGEAILEGAAEFLMKPFDRDLLTFKLRQSGVLPPGARPC
jgi:two-component system, chemotaxis family, chemotaxis protein CheY